MRAGAEFLPLLKPGSYAHPLLVTGAVGFSFLLFWWLSHQALERHLLVAAARDQERLETGWIWDFDRGSDLVGGTATGLLDLQFNQGQISGTRGSESGFVSLNFRSHRIDARVHHRLQLRIWRQHPAAIGIHHREFFDGPVISTPKIHARAGWQVVEVDLSRRDWFASQYRDQVLAQGPSPARWGGDSGVVVSLRIHPSIRADNAFAIDWIKLLPAEPINWSQRPLRKLLEFEVPVPEDDQPVSRTPLLTVATRGMTVERILHGRDLIKQGAPAASLLPRSDTAAPSPVDLTHQPSRLSLILALSGSLAGVLAALLASEQARRRPVALVQLTGLSLLAALLLRWIDIEPYSNPIAMLTLALLIVLLLVILWRNQQSGLLHSVVHTSAWLDTSRLLVACLIPLLIYVLWSDQAILPSPSALLARFGKYLAWSALQQLVLCLILLGIMQRLEIGKRAAVLGAAILFGLAHYPNFSLMAASLVMALMCLWLYRRHGSLVPGIALHATLGTLYLEFLPPALLRSGAIGERFFLLQSI